jgi:topoisomerase-4 subunit B
MTDSNDLFSALPLVPKPATDPVVPKPVVATPAAAPVVEQRSGASTTLKADTGDYNASTIEVLEGLEPVRMRPGMYIGGTDEKALHHLFAEVIDNSMDEAVAGHANFIEVHLDRRASSRSATTAAASRSRTIRRFRASRRSK